MGVYRATIRWELGDGDFCGNRYSRGHRWEFDGNISVPASASPAIVPLPHSVAEAVDPEEAFVAALSSCHMLFFLSLAAARGVVVESYVDAASGRMQRGSDGKTRIDRVELNPAATYAAGTEPSKELLDELHHAAHERCFIANSVTAEVVTQVQC